MGTFITIILWGIALFTPIIIYNHIQKRSNIAYYILFIAQLIIYFFAADALRICSKSTSDAMGSGMASAYGVIYSIAFQVGLTILTLIVLGIKSILYSRRSSKSL